MNDKTLHYRIKYQDSDVAIMEFSKRDVVGFLNSSSLWTENSGDDPYCFWECFADTLLEIHGVHSVFVHGYDVLIIKDYRLQNWGKVLEDVVWCSLLFINPGGKAVEVFKNGKKFGKVVAHSFNATEPKSKKS